MVEIDQVGGGGGSRVALNTASLAVSGAAGLVFTVVQLSLLSRFLAEESFGLFVALRGFSLLLGTIALAGLPQVLVRYMPSLGARGDRTRAMLLFGVSTAVVVALGTTFLLTRGLWRPLLPSSARALIAGDAILFWTAAAAITLALKLLLYGAFAGLREMRMQLLFEPAFLFAFTLFIVLRRDALDVPSLFRAIALLNGIVFLAGLSVYRALLGRRFAATVAPSTDTVMPRFLPYWGGSVLLSFVALAFTDVDRFVMSTMLPVSAVSLFHVASRVQNVLKRFLGLPVVAASPEITRLYEEGRMREIGAKIRVFTHGSIVAALFIAAGAAIAGRHLIELLSGEAYAGAYRVLLFLLPTIPLSATAAPLLAAMRSLHAMRWAVACDFVWMAVYFGLFAPLVGAVGIVGMALAQGAACVAQLTVAILVSRRQGLWEGIGRRTAVLAVLLSAVAVAGAWLTGALGPVATVVFLLIFPFAARGLVATLGIFDEEEIADFLAVVPAGHSRRLVAWLLHAGSAR